MENQIDIGNQNTQQIGQNNVNQPMTIPEKPRVNYLMIGGAILVCLIVFGLGGYYLGKQSSSKTESNMMPTSSPTPSKTSGNIADWVSYDITTEPLLGYVDYTVKIPSSWKRIEHSSNFQDTETFQDTYEQFTYRLVIHQEKNYNSKTGKAYTTLKELTGFPYDVTTLMVDGQQAARVLPRAGSESIYKVLFFSKDAKLVLSVELETPQDGSKIQEGEELFNQILSTLKITAPTATKTENQIGYIKSIFDKNSRKYLTIDYIQWLNQTDGSCRSSTEGNSNIPVCNPNGYLIVNNNSQVRTFEIPGNVVIDFSDFKNAGLGWKDNQQLSSSNITLNEFEEIFSGKDSSIVWLKDAVYRVEITNDKISKIRYQYQP